MARRCASCSIFIDAKFCTECGKATVEATSSNSGSAGGFGCTQCGMSYSSAQKFCGECGGHVAATSASKPQPKEGACHACGGDNIPGAKFCVHCGATLSGAAAAKPVSAVQRGYIPPDHTSHIPVVVEQPKVSGRLKAYRPPDHTSNIPVVKEVADVYTGQYQTTTDISSQKQ